MPPMTQTLHRRSAPVVPNRFRGLLPHRMLRWRRPLWWQELAIVAFGYWVYSLGRNAIPNDTDAAFGHARALQHVQTWLHLGGELAVNKFVAAHEWLAQPMDYYYASLHFVVTPAVLVWLYMRRPHVYRGARTVLVGTTLLALVGFYFDPTAPPRLLPGFGYIDTVARFHTWGSLADPHIAQHSNQYAAMPSLHIGWALWCGVTIFACARHTWVRVLGLGYPVATFVVIIGTANHFVLDAAGGALIVVAAFAGQWLLSGHGAFTPPLDAPDFALPAPAVQS